MGSVVKSIGGVFGANGGGGGPGPKLSKSPFDIKAPAAKYEQKANALEQQAGARTEAIQAPQLLQQLRQQALGQGPSLAEAQLKSVTTRNLAQQLAAAASMRGRNPAAAQRQALQQQGAAGRDLANASGQARLQEAQGAQQLLLQQQAQADALAQQSGQQGYERAVAPQQALQDYELARFGADVNKTNQIKQQQNAILGGVLGAAGQGVGSLLSDKSEKKNIKNASKDVDNFLEALSAKSYEYKDAAKPGAAEGKRYGVMAQDLEKSSAGKSIVKDTAQGKMVDTNQGFGLIVAAQKELHERLKALEGKKKA